MFMILSDLPLNFTLPVILQAGHYKTSAKATPIVETLLFLGSFRVSCNIISLQSSLTWKYGCSEIHCALFTVWILSHYWDRNYENIILKLRLYVWTIKWLLSFKTIMARDSPPTTVLSSLSWQFKLQLLNSCGEKMGLSISRKRTLALFTENRLVCSVQKIISFHKYFLKVSPLSKNVF